MMPPTKDQTDLNVDEPTIDCSVERDRTDQRFKDEADINYMLSRFSIVPPRGTPTYGEWDDSIDLMSALTSVQEAREAYAKLPNELTEKFKNMEQLLNAVENGSLVLKNEEAPAPQKTETQLLQERITELEKGLNTTTPNS